MEARGVSYEWERLRDDLDDLSEIHLEAVGRQVIVRSLPRGQAGRALQAVGVALGPAVQILDPAQPSSAAVGE